MNSKREAGRLVIRVACGKCGRTIDRLGAERDLHVYYGGGAAESVGVFDQRLDDTLQGNARVSSRRAGDAKALWLRCHRRCGADWRIAEDRMAAALEAARADGRREVVVGVDV